MDEWVGGWTNRQTSLMYIYQYMGSPQLMSTCFMTRVLMASRMPYDKAVQAVKECLLHFPSHITTFLVIGTQFAFTTLCSILQLHKGDLQLFCWFAAKNVHVEYLQLQ